MPNRTDDCKEQIRVARQMPSSPGAGAERREATEPEACRNAERPAESHPGAPSKLPGFSGSGGGGS